MWTERSAGPPPPRRARTAVFLTAPDGSAGTPTKRAALGEGGESSSTLCTGSQGIDTHGGPMHVAGDTQAGGAPASRNQAGVDLACAPCASNCVGDGWR